MPSLTPQLFVSTWRNSTLKERSAAQEHFIGLCQLIDHPTPAQHDSTGQSFTFEAGVSKTGGGDGFADVFKRGYFAWEYKGKHADLDKAYQQLLQYRESLENPPLLVVSDLNSIVVHTNFTGTAKRVITLTLDDLLSHEGRETLRAIFNEPERFRRAQTSQQVTETAAAEFAKLSDALRAQGCDPHEAAHFLIRLLFSLFAEDAGVLPKGIFTQIVTNARRDPAAVTPMLADLFAKMASGGYFGAERIPYFNGRLFDNATVLELDREAVEILYHVAALDWASIEPSIFGTLFERSLDPSKRAQLGVQYTSKADIMLVVEPVLMEPLRREWDEARAEVDELVAKWREAAAGKKPSASGFFNKAVERLQRFSRRLAEVTVLDPACGSGNFLYVALRLLLDLEKEVIAYAGTFGATSWFPHVSPAQLRGIEKDDYAHELAQATIQIGYIQWLNENGFGIPPEPILQRLDNIEQRDAILEKDDAGGARQASWPESTVAVGNPPFLGSRKMRPALGDAYCDALKSAYSGDVEGLPDLVCFWFERARQMIASGTLLRAAFIATQAIRSGTSRRVLERIVESGRIDFAWSDRDWLLEGAIVRVSIVGFSRGDNVVSTMLDGREVGLINPDLTAGVAVASAVQLKENSGISFQGVVLRGGFNIDDDIAQQLLNARGNPNGKANSEVVRRRLTGRDLVTGATGWVIDFGPHATLEEAAGYAEPFEYVRRVVYPERQKANQKSARESWWIHWNPRLEMRTKLLSLSRYIATPRVAKHRIFEWLAPDILPDAQLVVFAREDDYFMGVLHSRVHELWARRMGSQLRDAESGFRYTSTTTFETFPMPWPPGHEPLEDETYRAIALASKSLIDMRTRWLTADDLPDIERRSRNLTALYNLMPTWLVIAHERIDAAVIAAYGWQHAVTDEEILNELLKLNQNRSGNGVAVS